jgi:superfamily II DNA/RNA helicase
LIKLYFGTSANTEELNNEIDTLLDESDTCRKKIEFMLQEVNKNVSCVFLAILKFFVSNLSISVENYRQELARNRSEKTQTDPRIKQRIWKLQAEERCRFAVSS